MALAGAVAASLTAASSFASVWLQDTAGPSSVSPFNSRLFLPELGFLLCTMGVIIVAVRKKRLRLMLRILTGVANRRFLDRHDDLLVADKRSGGTGRSCSTLRRKPARGSGFVLLLCAFASPWPAAQTLRPTP